MILSGCHRIIRSYIKIHWWKSDYSWINTDGKMMYGLWREWFPLVDAVRGHFISSVAISAEPRRSTVVFSPRKAALSFSSAEKTSIKSDLIRFYITTTAVCLFFVHHKHLPRSPSPHVHVIVWDNWFPSSHHPVCSFPLRCTNSLLHSDTYSVFGTRHLMSNSLPASPWSIPT